MSVGVEQSGLCKEPFLYSSSEYPELLEEGVPALYAHQ